MSRELVRRVALLENARLNGGVQHVVSDRANEDEGDPAELSPLLTEAEWVARFCMSDHHWSDCAVFNEPASPPGKCNCGGLRPGRKSTP